MNLGLDRSSYLKSVSLSNLLACLSCCAGNFAETAESALALTADCRQSKGCRWVVYHSLGKSASTLFLSVSPYLLIGNIQKRIMGRIIIEQIIVRVCIFC